MLFAILFGFRVNTEQFGDLSGRNGLSDISS